MDAKPQRPLRALRMRNDENMPPEGPLAKTIHHRNKSSPALTTANAAGFKTAAKRTAFGDVSNILGGAKPSKDDSSIATKLDGLAGGKPGGILPEKRSAAFLRPAQRPLSVSSLRSLLTGSHPTPATEAASTAALHDIVAEPAVANTRKVLTKRNTTIFKDTVLGTVQENVTTLPTPATLPTGTLVPEAACMIPQSRLHLPPPVTATFVEPTKESQTLHSDASASGIDEVKPLDHPTFSEAETHLAPIQDSISYLDQVCIHEPLPPITEQFLSIDSAPVVQSDLPTIRKVDDHAVPMIEAIIPAQAPSALPAHYVQQPTRPEPEEYWDEEEGDAYEEEGYVTARSFRSKGENTTGGVTAILFPQMNQRSRREISAAKQLVEATRTAEDIEDESFDTSMVAEYGDEIFDYMRELEVKLLPNAHYMDNQHEIQWSMRSVLMDWLVQVHHRFNLLPETLFLCVNYIDRFLSCKVVSLGKLQLVGATAIFIAAKYEEINCPSVQEIVYMVDGGYTIDEVLKAERFMLTMLQFELGWPGPMSFLRRISKADDYDLETRTLAKYFLEVTVMDERFIGSPPSFTAAASHCLARLMLRKGVWTSHHICYSGYTFAQLRPLLKLLLETCEDPRKHHSAVYNKYCDKRYKRASAFVETEIQRGFDLPETPGSRSMIQPPPAVAYYDSTSYFRA